VLRTGCRAWRKARFVVALCVIVAMTACLMACSDDHSSSPPQPPEAALPITPGGLFASLLQGIVSGIGTWSAEEGLGWLLSLAGVDQDKITEAMKQQMQEMNAKLDEIINQLQIIEDELLDILKAIQMAQDAIINNNENLHIADDLNVITNQYANLQYFTVDVMGTPEGKAQAQQMATDILSASAYDIDQKLYNIYAGVMGTDPGIAEGAMSAWTTTLIDKVGTEDLLNLYLSLEYYFGSLISTQSKGLSLMVEALHHRDNPISADTVLPGDYPGTAKEYLEQKFTPWMEDETEEFLRCVDRLVVAGLDLRTDATSQVAMLSDDVQQIYFRADFLAAQVSSRHPFGLVIRVTGEPDSVQAYIKDKVQVLANHEPMQVVPVGVAPKEEDVRLTAVEHWMYWPAGYTQAYMQWNWGQCEFNSARHEGFISFNSATDVAVVKFSLPGAMSGNYDVVLDAPRETPGAKGVQVALYDKDGQKVDQAVMNTHLYGNSVIPVRHGPTWSIGDSMVVYQDHRIDPTYDYSLTDHPPWARVKARLVENVHWYNSHAGFDMQAWLALPILNGMSSQKQQRVTCNARIRGQQGGGLDKGKDYLDYVDLKWDGNVGEIGGEGYWDSTSGDHTLNWAPHCYANYTGSTGDPAYLILEARIANNVRGSEDDYLQVKAWVDHSYLFF
jgi:hypothetical protein